MVAGGLFFRMGIAQLRWSAASISRFMAGGNRAVKSRFSDESTWVGSILAAVFEPRRHYFRQKPAVMNQPETLKSNSGSSRGKRWLFRIGLLAIVLISCELIAGMFLRMVLPQGDLNVLKEAQQSVATGALSSDGASEAIHPYLGWVHNPQLSVPDQVGGRDIQTNSLGFRDNAPSVVKKSPDQFIVGITGGSVAWRFSWEAEQLLTSQLQALPAIQGRTIRYVRLAMPGYKQPQQLMALNYVMALGGEFDAVLNLDGFNDGVLSVMENGHQRTAIDYPRSWHARALVMTDPRVSAQAWQLLQSRAERQQRATDALNSPLNVSNLYQAIWYLRDEFARNSQMDLGLEVSLANDTSFVHRGPESPVRSDAELVTEAAALWARCSSQMHDLCTARGILYLHVLQPNQYVAGSKPLSDYEKEFCFAGHQPLAIVAEQVFPMLVQQGAELQKKGVAFSDQTMVFSEVKDTLYVDPWCHFNQRGNELLAGQISQEFGRLLTTSSNP